MEGSWNILAGILTKMDALGPFHRFQNQLILAHHNSCYIVLISLLFDEFLMVLLHVPLVFIVWN